MTGCPNAQIPIEVVGSPANHALALEVARQSLVLLKNEGNLLPLNKDLKQVAVIGPNADDELVLRGNYYGTPTQSVTVLEGIRSILPGQTEVAYEPGCDILGTDKKGIKAAVKLARKADLAIVVLGLSQLVEGEEGQQEGVAEGLQSNGDRADLALPGVQQALLEAVAERDASGVGAVEWQRFGDQLGAGAHPCHS